MERVVRILLVNHEFSVSGASVLLLNLGLRLKALGHAITVAGLDPRPGRISAAYARAGVAVVDHLDTSGYDVAIANTVAAARFVARMGAALPTVWWLHEAEFGLAMLLRDTAQLRAFEAASAIVFQTDYQRDDVYRSFTYLLPPERLHVFANGVGVEDRTPPEAAAARQGVLRIVSVGAVYPRKRHSDLIEAVVRLRTKLDIELVICGAVVGGLNGLAEQAVRDRPDRIVLTGEVARPACLGWIASADIFCLASSDESQPLTILEAGALGKPLVLSDLRSYEGVLRHGTNCLLFPVGDVDLLSHALGALAADPARRQRLGEAARATAARFTERPLHARFLALLEDVASSARRTRM